MAVEKSEDKPGTVSRFSLGRKSLFVSQKLAGTAQLILWKMRTKTGSKRGMDITGTSKYVRFAEYRLQSLLASGAEILTGKISVLNVKFGSARSVA